MARTIHDDVQAAIAAADRGEAVTVTDDNFEALLLASARQAAEIAEGTREPSRQYTLEHTERDTTVRPPRAFSRDDVVALRNDLRVSQAVFAGVVGVSAHLERAWELGTRTPQGAAARVLELIAQRPQAMQGLVIKRTTTKPTTKPTTKLATRVQGAKRTRPVKAKSTKRQSVSRAKPVRG